MSQQAPQENIDLLGELDVGMFARKFARAMADVALGVITTGKKGKVQLTFDLAQVAHGHQVNIKHQLKFAKPTENGQATEDNTTETAVYVGFGGKLTLLPDSQDDMFKRREAAKAAARDGADTAE
ncbi:MAG TPA: hypothetical protein VFG73_02475 [Rhodanobacteraceae bacterium]|nr:hypothetical protein [Rhodanobacteraceae bacterium]